MLVNLAAVRRFNQEVKIRCVAPLYKNRSYSVISVFFSLSLMQSRTRLMVVHVARRMKGKDGTMITCLSYIYDYYDYNIIIILYLTNV